MEVVNSVQAPIFYNRAYKYLTMYIKPPNIGLRSLTRDSFEVQLMQMALTLSMPRSDSLYAVPVMAGTRLTTQRDSNSVKYSSFHLFYD
jgi:hypothetical protein